VRGSVSERRLLAKGTGVPKMRIAKPFAKRKLSAPKKTQKKALDFLKLSF